MAEAAQASAKEQAGAPSRGAKGPDGVVARRIPVGGRWQPRPGLPPAAIAGLGGAGNAAVAQLVGGDGRGAGVIQRCGPVACDCPEESQTGAHPHDADARPPAGATVQRGVLASVASAVLPDWVNDLITTVPNQAQAAAGAAAGDSGQATAASDAQTATAASTAQAATGAAVSAGQQASQATEGQARLTSAAAEAGGKAELARAERAANAMGSVGASAGTMLNPVAPVVDVPAVKAGVDHAASVVAAIPGGAADLAGDMKTAVTDGMKAGGSEGWDCDQSEVMAMAGGVKKALTNAAVAAGKKVLGADRFAALQDFVGKQVSALKSAAESVKGIVGSITDRIKKAWDEHVGPLMAKVETLIAAAKVVFDRIRDEITTSVNETIEQAKKAWAAVKEHIIDPVMTRIEQAKELVSGLFSKAKSALGSWWENLPGWAQGGIMAIAGLVTGPIGLALLAAKKAADLLESRKQGLFDWVKSRVDAVLPLLAKGYNWVKEQVGAAASKLKEWGKAAFELAKSKAKAAYKAVDDATGGRLTAFGAALSTLKQKITGAVCTTLGDAAGPCVNQWVPDAGENAKEGESADVTLTSTASATVPVYGVPVKIAQGSSVKISRKGKKYQVIQQGDGAIAVSYSSGGGGGGGGGVSVDASLPGVAGDAWKAITGKSGPSKTFGGGSGQPGGAPGQPAPGATGPPAGTAGPTTGGGGGGAPAAGGGAPAAGGGPEVSAEAGYKGSVSMTYDFDASSGKDTTCDGLGGMAAMLAGQGLGKALPPPVGNLIGAVTEGSYAENISSCVFTFAEYGQASVDIKKDGIGGIKAAVSGEAGVSVERAKDEAGNFTDTATLSASLGASGALELAMGGVNPLAMGAAAGVTGTLFVKLSYAEALDKISALSAGAKVSGTLALSPPQVTKVLPDSIAEPVLAKLGPYLAASIKGTLGVEASFSLENLHVLMAALDAYLATPSSVNTDGVIDLVRKHFAQPANTKKAVVVTLATSESLGGVSVSGGGQGTSGSAGIAASSNRTKVLYP